MKNNNNNTIGNLLILNENIFTPKSPKINHLKEINIRNEYNKEYINQECRKLDISKTGSKPIIISLDKNQNEIKKKIPITSPIKKINYKAFNIEDVSKFKNFSPNKNNNFIYRKKVDELKRKKNNLNLGNKNEEKIEKKENELIKRISDLENKLKQNEEKLEKQIEENNKK